MLSEMYTKLFTAMENLEMITNDQWWRWVDAAEERAVRYHIG